MRTFKDVNNKEWAIAVNVGSLGRVRGALDMDLLNLFNEGLESFLSDPVTIGAVLWVLVKDQAEKAPVSEVQFAEALLGDAFDDAARALVRAIVDFFPKRKSETLHKILDKAGKAEEQVAKRAGQEVDAISVKTLTEKILRTSDVKPTSSPTAAPESSASTPSPSP